MKNITEMNKQEFQEWLASKPENFKKLYTEKYINQINWDYVPIETIQKYKDLIDWDYISKYQQLSEDFIAKHKDLVNWTCISSYQHLSEDFIEEYKDLLDWDDVSKFQRLSEDFIEAHKDLVNWAWISTFQQLSEDFIENHKGLIDWAQVSKCQQLSNAFIKAHKTELNMSLVNDNWLNKDTEFKKKAVIDTGLYECHEDYFIAYKGIRSDRYSAFNFQYKYLPGNTYTCFADGSRNENSFGLSVWDESNARDYCSELVVKCKIFYEDVARVVHDGGKIRCSKVTILD